MEVRKFNAFADGIEKSINQSRLAYLASRNLEEEARKDEQNETMELENGLLDAALGDQTALKNLGGGKQKYASDGIDDADDGSGEVINFVLLLRLFTDSQFV